jgi:DMSO/TMAO reductase YedYZ molybdopterin-dependent catalytic subunit
MDALMASGFITPPSLHYVRNHGAVPKISWSSHRLTINGLVDKTITLTMDELIALPSVTLPVTLVCAGNRCAGVAPAWCKQLLQQRHCAHASTALHCLVMPAQQSRSWEANK